MSEQPQRLSMTREEYREVYLRSPHWQKMRRAAIRAAGERCQICYSPDNLDAHHRTYDRLGHEHLGDLTALCRRCHNLFHGVLPQIGSKPPTRTGPKNSPSKKARRRARRERKRAREESLQDSLAAMKERNGPLRMSDYGAAVRNAESDGPDGASRDCASTTSK